MSSNPAPTPAPAPVHHKLPGGGLSWSGRGKLWLGDDHLLEVNTLFVVEWYRRFFFREIKALTVRRTKTRFVWAMIQIGVGAIFAAIAAVFAWYGTKVPGRESPVVLYIFASLFGAVAVVCFVLLAFNLAMGPSCRCYVLTATGWQALAAPARLGPATQTQARIIPLIEAAQGGAPEPVSATPYQGTS